MTMTWALFLNPALLPFHFCVLAIFVLIIAETVGIYIQYRPSHIVRGLVPEWLRESPILQVKISRFIIVLFFLINLSFAGYFFQLSFYAWTHEFLSSSIVILPAFIMAWFFTLFMIHCLDQVIKPYQATQRVKLIGRLATIVSGYAKPGASAQATLRDEFGHLHFIQVQPEFGELEPLSQVVLVGFADAHYIVQRLTT